MFIGKRMKELREEKGLKLIDLAAQSGIQLATLSRMENLKMVGTVESHMKIAKALNIDIAELYKDMLTEANIQELKAVKPKTEMFVRTDRASYEMLTTRLLSKKMMPVLITIEEGGKTNAEKGPPGMEKFIYVIEGKVKVKVDKEIFPLSRSNALYFDASLEHSFTNTGKAPAKIICVATPVAI